MFYEGSNASASGYGVTHVRDRQMAAQPQAALQETEYGLRLGNGKYCTLRLFFNQV